MLKTTLTVLVTATVCFAIAATTVLAAGERRVFKFQVGDVATMQTANIQCQALSKTRIACGQNKIANAVHVYFDPHQVNVIKFNAAGTKYSILWQAKR
jgi:hypothetical protein